ncbi:MAG: putative glycoside hydrolase [Acidobacteriia bacterium]|nr:GTP-binding protein [Methyloceanibacter sp.]MCL6492885.1 putative glycoside hydrolase [Terriglobia bacterium]
MVFIVVFGVIGVASSRDLSGRVIDAETRAAIGGATLTVGDHAIITDDAGRFDIKEAVGVLRVRSPGYSRKEIGPNELGKSPIEIRLTPFLPKALYLSFYGIGSTALRNAALRLIREAQLNAVVIDVKGDRGLVAYRSSVPLAAAIGAQRIITIPNLPGLLQTLHQDGLYTIARIVVFKDDPLASARPDLAVRRLDGGIFRDREGLRWVDPTRREVWDYNIAIAVEAAKAGFDEIQFDYLRFPDSKEIRLPVPNTQETRVKAITEFIDAARTRLVPYNVFLAVDVFGYICWNLDDTHIGQRLEDILPRVDYLSPMLYPSGFQFGIPGYRNPVAHIYEIVHRSLERIRVRTHVSPRRIRPWLQAFRDYAFDRRQFGAYEIRQQIRAAEDFGTDGWMLWNPRNVYSDQGLVAKTAAACW